MNIYIDKISKISENFFGFSCGEEKYVVIVKNYLPTGQPEKNYAYIDKYYDVSNQQYHMVKDFLVFLKKFGVVMAVEKEKNIKSFLSEKGFFHQGKNTLLSTEKYGTRIYFSLLKVKNVTEINKTFGDYFPKSENLFESEFAKYFSNYSNEEKEEIYKEKTRLSYAKFWQILLMRGKQFERENEKGFASDDFCDGCRLCVENCPQKALPNLTFCYRQYMQKGEILESFSSQLGNRVLGCDICQKICPKNRNIPYEEGQKFSLEELLLLVEKKDENLCERYGKNIISKNKLIPFILNSMRNAGNEKYLKYFEKYRGSENENISKVANFFMKGFAENEIEEEEMND